MAITRPGSRAAVTESLSVGADLQGCIQCTRERERKALNNHAAYALVEMQMSRYRSVPLRVTFRRIRLTEETPPPND